MADDELPPPRGVRWELSETVRLSLGAKRSSTTRLSPSLRRADAPKAEPPNLTKHQTLQPQYGRGSCALLIRPLLHKTHPDASFVITTSTRPLVNTDPEHINKQATHTPAATHTVTSALNEAHCRHTEQATKIMAGRGPPPHPQCLIYRRRVIIGIQKQKRARKGLTSQRHRTVIRTIGTRETASERKGKQFGQETACPMKCGAGTLVSVVVRCIAATRAAGTVYE
ncbi:hypothetical protein CEP54_015612 [Fusarium duplospermum]|uniref:Uncharacterized protein n=1 Tax=Fusarium duplospermum TaxID=1325734 RepID=A0A428NMR4_9HYPO|nr:hypothetical protein CEP54_015612 [Fusarium duplospermum]